MKKRAALLLIFPALALLGGCTIPEGVKSALYKTKDVVVGTVNKAVDAMDNFFSEPAEEEKKDENKEEKTTEEETSTTTNEPGEGEGQEESGEDTGSEGN